MLGGDHKTNLRRLTVNEEHLNAVCGFVPILFIVRENRYDQRKYQRSENYTVRETNPYTFLNIIKETKTEVNI